MLSCGRRENVSTTEEKKQENEEGRKNYGGGDGYMEGSFLLLVQDQPDLKNESHS